MDNIVLKTAFLYPDIFCLNGDRGNIYALSSICEKLGINMIIDRINSPDSLINFDIYDIVYIPSGELKYVILTAQALEGQISSIKRAVSNGKIFLITGTSIALFANKIIRADKSEHKALGLADFDCIEKSEVYGDDLVFDADIFGTNLRITGCQISLINTILQSDAAALGNVIYGYGNNKGKDEGVKKNNCILTNTLGPLLVKNPELVVLMIKQTLKNRDFKTELKKLDFKIENKSAKKIWEFIEQKIKA